MTRSMNFDVTAGGNAEAEFLQYGIAVDKFEDKLRKLGQMKAEPTVDVNITPATLKTNQLKSRLDALKNVRTKVEVEGAAEARVEVTALVVELKKIKDAKSKVDVQTGTAKADLTTIAAKLSSLGDKSVKLDVTTGQAEQRVTSIDNRLTALKLMSPVKIEVRVDHNDVAMARIQALVLAARGLAAERPNIQVTADTAAVGAQLAALLAQVRALSNAEHTVRVRLEGQSLLAQLASIQAQLNTLAGGSIEITAETRQLMTQLAEARVELARLEAMDPTVVIEADTELARHRIELLERQLHAIAAEQYDVKLDVDKDGTISGKMAAIAAAAALLPSVLGSSTAAAASLAGSLVAIGGAAPVAVGGLMAVVAVVGAYKLGVQGLDDAFKNLDDPEKLAESLKDLSPAAREFVLAVRDARPAFESMQLDVQQRLLAGYGDQVELLADRLLPSMKTGLGGIAGELNLTGKELVGWVTSAEGVRDVDAIFANTNKTLAAARPALTNVVAGLADVGVVGSAVLPELVSGWASATGEFREYVASAEGQREVEVAMRRGIDTVQTLGSVLGNVGGIAVGVFDAAEASGADFLNTLDRVTGGVERYVRSAEGQTALTDFFRESRDVVDELTPGVESLGKAAGQTMSEFSNTGGASAFASSVSDIAATVAPLLPDLGQLGGATLGNVASGMHLAASAVSPLVDGLQAILEFAGPVTPAILAMMVAFAGGVAARAAVLGLSSAMAAASTSAGAYVLGMTGSAAAGQAVASGVTRGAGAVAAFGRALPVVAVATVALGMAMDSMSSSTDEAVTAMTAGGTAADNMRQQLLSQTGQLDSNGQATRGLAADINNWVNSNVFGIASIESTNAAMAQQRSEMTSLQRAQQDVTIAQGEYQQAVDLFTANSPDARIALADLTAAQDRLELEQVAARNATDLHTAAMIQQADQALAAANAGRGYEGALLNLERAQRTATEATQTYGAASLEAREADFALESQLFATAAAAGEKARADGIAAGAANVDQLAVEAQRGELIRLAEQSSGPTRQGLLDAAAAMDTQAGSADLARVQAQAHRDMLGQLAGQASGPLAQAMRDAAAGFDTLGGAHATAQERARLQEQALRNLANMASGQLRTELNAMADQLRNIPDAEFNVTATGRGKFAGIPSGVSTPGRLATGGVWGGPGHITRAATGTVLPGYTPGRDVHSFASPTAGRLDLSGGEAVMRPEWTRAVGPDFVHAANRAARSGGIAGVQNFMARTAPRRSAMEGRGGDGSRFASGGVYPTHYRGPVQRLAFGGLVRLGTQPMSAVVNAQYVEARDRMADHLTPLMQAEIKKMEAAALAASGSGPTTAGASAGLAWARTQVGKPYVWGGVGPGGYDCSGFMSAIVNVMRGRNPHMRVGATATFPWGGFAPGIGPGLNIGAFKGNPGHMAGTIGGVNVESSGSVGVRVGGGARGAGDGMFTTRAHLADRGGMFRSGTAALNLSGRAERALTGRQNESFERFVALLTSPRGRGFMRAPGPLSAATPLGSAAPVPLQMRDVLGQTRQSGSAMPRIDLGALAQQLAGLRADLMSREPQVINQTVQTSDPAEAGRLAVLNMRIPRR